MVVMVIAVVVMIVKSSFLMYCKMSYSMCEFMVTLPFKNKLLLSLLILTGRVYICIYICI